MREEGGGRREWRRGDEREEGGKCECYEDRRRQSPFFVEMLLVGAFFW